MPFKSYLPANPLPVKKTRAKRNALKRAKILPRPGTLSTSEKSTIENVIRDLPGEIAPAQIDALAVVLRREPTTIVRAVESAKRRLQENASKYAEIHMQATEKALGSNDPKALETARKASEWALERISAKDDTGKEIRVIDSSSQASTAPVIKIGIALGGLPSHKPTITEE